LILDPGTSPVKALVQILSISMLVPRVAVIAVARFEERRADYDLAMSAVLDQRTKSLEERYGFGGVFVHLPVPADQRYAQNQNACRLASARFV
jgi:uncharacterized membrane protein